MTKQANPNVRPNIPVIWPTEGPMEAFHNQSPSCLSDLQHNGGPESEWKDFIKDQFEGIHYPDALMNYRNPSDLLIMQLDLANDVIFDHPQEVQRMEEIALEAKSEPTQTAVNIDPHFKAAA